MRILIIFCILTSFSSYSQNTGLYGKRTYVELNTTAHYRLFHTIFMQNDMYEKTSVNSLQHKKDRFDYGFNFTIGHATKRGIAASLEFGMAFSDIEGPEFVQFVYTDNWGYTGQNDIYVQHEAIQIRTMQIMPKIEFNSASILPVGLNHQIGIGFNRTSIVEKDYYGLMADNFYNIPEAEFNNALKETRESIDNSKGFTLMYAFNIRTPISKSLLINYGFRYTLNINRGLRGYYRSYERNIAYSRLANVINLNLGLTYAF